MQSYIILTAAGSGTRLGAKIPKALVEVAGKPLLAQALTHLPKCEGIVVTAPPDALPEFQAVIDSVSVPSPVSLVAGGRSRQESVSQALTALPPTASDTALVLVHDAARAFTPPDVFSRVLETLKTGYSAVIPALPLNDTIKAVTPGSPGSPGLPETPGSPGLPETPGSPEMVRETLQRDQLRAVQTPQGFPLALLRELHERFSEQGAAESSSFGDDASLAEAAGIPVAVVPGDSLALKITTPADLAVIRALLDTPPPQPRDSATPCG